MKAQAASSKQSYTIAGTGKTRTLFLRENIEEAYNADGDVIFNYDEYRLEIRNRLNLESYVTNNFDALILKAKQAEIVQVKVNLEKAIDRHIDRVAKDKGYGREGLSPSAACLGYASFTSNYQTEAIAYGEWIASLWPVVYQIMQEVEAGTRDIPTAEELIAEMPEMLWPV
jgi:hypothetical protein